ncbi:MAG: ADP-ribosylglycohydrolase family protein [Armatimonadota bacterium]
MTHYDRIAGCLLGGATGDALGAPIEFMSVDKILSIYGRNGIEHYAPEYGRIGAITDDTQMTLFTLEGMMIAQSTGQSPLNTVRDAYIRWLGTQGTVSRSSNISPTYSGWLWDQKALHSNRVPGGACLSSLKSHLSRMERGDFAISDAPINISKGCGGIMRMSPVGFFDTDCFSLGCDLARLTHGHPSGYLASGFLAHLIHELIQGADLIDAIESAKERLIQQPSHEEVLLAVDRAISCANGSDVTPEGLEQLGGGWVAEEALAISLLCALKAKDFAHGIRLAVNHGGDSDSTGAITGNILGAMWGRQSIPDEFLLDLELRSIIEQMASDVSNLDIPEVRQGRYSSTSIGHTPATSDKASIQWIQPDVTPVPFPRSYWVSQGTFLAGCYPGHPDALEAQQKLSSILKAGIKTIICLMEEAETDHNSKPFTQYETEFCRLADDQNIDVMCIRHPIRDNSAPSRATMSDVLDSIDTSIRNGSPVFVHCWGGYGRTGAVVGCWLARHGVAQGDKVLKMIKHLRRNEQTGHKPSPQTADQYSLVASWNRGE